MLRIRRDWILKDKDGRVGLIWKRTYWVGLGEIGFFRIRIRMVVLD